jgi:hypothetical protein
MITKRGDTEDVDHAEIVALKMGKRSKISVSFFLSKMDGNGTKTYADIVKDG